MAPKDTSTKLADDEFVGQTLLDALESGVQLPSEPRNARWKGEWSPSKAQQTQEPQVERQHQPRHQQTRYTQRQASSPRSETPQSGVDISKVDWLISSSPSPQSFFDKWNGVPLAQPYHPSLPHDWYPHSNAANYQPPSPSHGTSARSSGQPLRPTAPGFYPVGQVDLGRNDAPVWLQPLQNIVRQHQSRAYGTKAQPIVVDSSEDEPPLSPSAGVNGPAERTTRYPLRTRQGHTAVTSEVPIVGSAQRPIQIDEIKNLGLRFSAVNFQPDAQKLTRYKNRVRAETPPLQVPEPTAQYLAACSVPLQPLPYSKQRLLVILDLNGTLLARTNHKASFKPRAHLDAFLRTLFQHHSVMIWSSSMPSNVHAMLAQILDQRQSKQLAAVWARDTLRLNPAQLRQKVQVYKQLSWVWGDDSIAAQHPDFTKHKQRWNQINTVLIDDSILKASAEPFNLLQIPEFVNGRQENDVLGQALSYLDWLSHHANVSAAIKSRPFMVNAGWGWNWERK